MPECEGGDAWKITGEGSLHDFTKAINISCNRLLWQELPGGQPQLKVLRKHLNYVMKTKKDADYGMLLCIASGGVWTNHKELSEGMSNSNGGYCSLCGCNAGAIRHRYYECTALLGKTGIVGDTQMLCSTALKSYDRQLGRWERALPMATWYDIPQVDEQAITMHMAGLEHGAISHKEWWADGSGGGHTADVRLRRCGWSCVAMDFHSGEVINRGQPWAPSQAHTQCQELNSRLS